MTIQILEATLPIVSTYWNVFTTERSSSSLYRHLRGIPRYSRALHPITQQSLTCWSNRDSHMSVWDGNVCPHRTRGIQQPHRARYCGVGHVLLRIGGKLVLLLAIKNAHFVLFRAQRCERPVSWTALWSSVVALPNFSYTSPIYQIPCSCLEVWSLLHK